MIERIHWIESSDSLKPDDHDFEYYRLMFDSVRDGLSFEGNAPATTSNVTVSGSKQVTTQLNDALVAAGKYVARYRFAHGKKVFFVFERNGANSLSFSPSFGAIELLNSEIMALIKKIGDAGGSPAYISTATMM